MSFKYGFEKAAFLGKIAPHMPKIERTVGRFAGKAVQGIKNFFGGGGAPKPAVNMGTGPAVPSPSGMMGRAAQMAKSPLGKDLGQRVGGEVGGMVAENQSQISQSAKKMVGAGVPSTPTAGGLAG